MQIEVTDDMRDLVRGFREVKRLVNEDVASIVTPDIERCMGRLVIEAIEAAEQAESDRT